MKMRFVDTILDEFIFEGFELFAKFLKIDMLRISESYEFSIRNYT